MTGYADVLNGLVYVGTQVSGAHGSYNAESYADAENASLADVSPVPLTYPHWVATLPWDMEQVGFESLAMGAAGGKRTTYFYHICHFAPVADNADFVAIMAGEAAHLDAYFAALQANPFLTGGQAPSMHGGYNVTFKPTRLALLKIQHHVIICKHKVELYS